MATDENVSLRRRFEYLKGVEQEKNDLIEILLSSLEKLTKDYREAKLDQAREARFNREGQVREEKLQGEIQNYKTSLERDPFVLVLIDGDGTIFHDSLIAKGEVGGKEAAGLLWNAIAANVHQKLPELGVNYRIVTRIYANLKGLGEVCNKSGMLDHAMVIEDFFRGFTGSKQLFDFIDVGTGKDRADDKISETFKLNLHDCHCRHIYFGCSHDNGYARLLEEFTEQTILQRVTLVEGVPFERELEQLKSRYQTIKFNGLFRTEKINIYKPQHHEYLGGSKAPPQTNGLAPHSTQYQSPYQLTIPRPPDTSSTALNPTAPSWAATAVAKGPLVSPPQTPQPSHQSLITVPRNRYGQRVDPVVTYDPSEIKRIKSKKLCNVHHLRNDCPYDPCTHDHFYNPTKNELSTLRYISRMTPCKYGTDCDDPKCIYGHRCPNDKEHSRECKWGENCRFDRDLHGIDRKVVETIKVGGR